MYKDLNTLDIFVNGKGQVNQLSCCGNGSGGQDLAGGIVRLNKKRIYDLYPVALPMGTDVKGNVVGSFFKILAVAGKGDGAGMIRNTQKAVLRFHKADDILRIIHFFQCKGAFRIILKGHEQDDEKEYQRNQ